MHHLISRYQNLEVDQLVSYEESPVTDQIASYMSAAQDVVQAVLDGSDAIAAFGVGLSIGLCVIWLVESAAVANP